jgi:hypothetical protein
MIRRKLLIAATILTSVVITACSDMTAPAEREPSGLASFARQCPALGALNMMHDPTMLTIPMVRNVQGNGNAGMARAVAVSGC